MLSARFLKIRTLALLIASTATLCFAFQADNIPGKVETSNLATSFSKHLAGADSAADDLVYVVGGIIFADDLALAGIRSDDTETLTRRTEH